MTVTLDALPRGTQLLYDGNRLASVPDSVADAFRPGDRLTVVQGTGDVLHIPAAIYTQVSEAVAQARAAFLELTVLPDERVDRFYDLFAARLEDEATWALIQRANDEDVRRARARGRSTTRLVADAKMRSRMVEGLRLWRDMPSRRDAVVDTVTHQGWEVRQVVSGLGVIGFVFEGRPNVFADATGVLRSGNTTVMRIGSDALGTARAISTHTLRPALLDAGRGGGAAGGDCAPARCAGEPARNRRRVDCGGWNCGWRGAGEGGLPLAGLEEVQHAEYVLRGGGRG
jgi:glutamate-5-semialdehyde dehydrogenase